MSVDTDAIKAANPIAEVIGQAVSLRKAGKEWKACCPFHAEKSPSFYVVPEKGLAHCFGCDWSGDVIQFVMDYKGVPFTEAVAALGGESMALDQSPDAKRARREENERREAEQQVLREAATAKAAKRWDAAQPADPHHPYLRKKGIEPHSIRQTAEGELILPVYDSEGEIQSVQTIDDAGVKRFQFQAPMHLGRFQIGIPFGRTIICEGFATAASIFDAIPDQVCVAYNCGNMEKIAREFAAEGRHFVLAADNNTEAASKMVTLGRELNVPVIIPPEVEMPDGEVGTDFNDMAQVMGVEAVARLFREGIRDFAKIEEARQLDDRREAGPVDLWAEPTIPPLPRNLLPPLVERFAVENAKLIGADPAGLAMAALAACGAALPDKVRAKPKVHENWTQPARLWVLLIGDASTNKSACVSRATDRIERLDVEMFTEANAKLSEWQRDKKDGIEQPKPRRPRLMLGDATVEATQEALKDSPDGLLLRQDEMSSLFAKCGQAGNQAERSFWLQTYNGGTYAVSRIGRGEYIIDNLSVSMLGGIQPTAMHTVVNSGDDDGLIQRFTPILLREGGEEMDVPIPPVNDEFAALIDTLRNFPCASNFLKPDAPYEFSEGAREVRVALLREFRELADNIKSVNVRLASHVGKYRGLFVRLCMLWHAIGNAERIQEGAKPEQEISAATARSAAKFITDYLFRHAFAFYRSTGSMTEDDAVVQAIGAWILANDIERFTVRDLVRNVRQFSALKDDMKKDRITGMMEAYGWAEPDPKKQAHKAWDVPPEVAEMYAEKAGRERDRRAAVKQIISEAVEQSRMARS